MGTLLFDSDDCLFGSLFVHTFSMPYVNNNVYLELAKLDYNNCQTLHLSEWDNLQK